MPHTLAQPKIWLVIDNGQFGGIETHVHLLAQTLIAHDIHVIVVFLHPCHDQPLDQALKILNIPTLHLANVWAFMQTLIQNPPQLLHTHGYKASIISKIIGVLRHIPVLSTYHSGERGTGRIRWYNAVDEWLSPLSSNIAVSRPILKRLRGQHNHLMHNFVPMASTPTQTKPFQKKVVFVGRIHFEKGPDIFCQLAQNLVNWHFTLIGDGPMMDALPQLPNLERLGAQAVTYQTYQNFDLLVITSRSEGLPLTALEAMASGTPTAAFAIGGLPNLIQDGNNGFLAPPGDVEAMAHKLQAFSKLNDKQRLAMAQAAQQTIQTGFSAETIVPEHMIPLYQALLSR